MSYSNMTLLDIVAEGKDTLDPVKILAALNTIERNYLRICTDYDELKKKNEALSRELEDFKDEVKSDYVSEYDLNDKISDLEEKCEDNERKIKEVESSLDDLKNDDDHNNLGENVEKLEKKVDELDDKIDRIESGMESIADRVDGIEK